MHSELISVVIPVFNGAAFVADAIRSVLSQTGFDIELIVVDDGSTDPTRAVAESFGVKVRYQHQQNQGASAARNHGFRLSTGNTIAFLDADDVWLPGALAAHFNCWSQSPWAHLTWGRAIVERLEPVSENTPAAHVRAVTGESERIMQLGSMLFRREALNRTGLFNVGQRFGEDLDLMMRVREAGLHSALHEEVVLAYRLHDHNMTLNAPAATESLFSALRSSLSRKRSMAAGSNISNEEP